MVTKTQKQPILGAKALVKAKDRHKLVGAKLIPPSHKPKSVTGHGGERPGAGRPTAEKGRVGGSRPGAGRKPGAGLASSTLARDILEGKRIIKEVGDELPDDCAPLDVMLMAMRSAYKIGGSMMAFPYAEKAAPYLHARLANIELTPPKGKGGIVFAWADQDVKAPELADIVEMEPIRKLSHG
jgi:hypothetical protein